MSLLEFPGGFVCPMPPPFATNVPGFVNSVLNDGADRVAALITIPKSGTLEWFEWRQGTNTVSPANGVRFSFQDPDGSGDPDGTEDQWCDITSGFGAPAWLVPPNALTNTGAGGGTKRTVTAGQKIFCVVSLPSFSTGSITMSQLDLAAAAATDTYWDYCDVFAASWAKNPNTPCIALKYADGTYGIVAPDVVPALAQNAVSYHSGSTPDERGLRFTLTSNCYIIGAWVRADLDNAADVVLYDASSAVIGSVSLASGTRSTTSAATGRVAFASTLLSAGLVYRLSLKPTTGSTVALYDFDVNSAALMAATPGGASWYFTARTDAGAWTDTTTKRPWMGIILGGIDSIPIGAEVAYPVLG